MESKYNGHSKRRIICATLGWTYREYIKKVWELYQQGNSAADICGIINVKLPKYLAITPRSIQRSVKQYANMIGKPNTIRTNAEGFKLKLARGGVKWAYKSIKARKNNIGSSKRYEVLKRDNFACVLCGATAKDDLLEVDHIKAITNGGNDDVDNLRTLCNQCNQGKRIVEQEK